EHEDRLGPVLLDDAEILEHRVGRASVPPFAVLLLGRHDVDELSEFAVKISPAAAYMLNQGVCLVLRQDEDLADARVDAVGQGEVDDAVLAAERRRGFRPAVRHLHETLAAAACHDDRHRAPGELTHYTMNRPGPHLRPAPVIAVEYTQRCAADVPLRIPRANAAAGGATNAPAAAHRAALRCRPALPGTCRPLDTIRPCPSAATGVRASPATC